MEKTILLPYDKYLQLTERENTASSETREADKEKDDDNDDQNVANDIESMQKDNVAVVKDLKERLSGNRKLVDGKKRKNDVASSKCSSLGPPGKRNKQTVTARALLTLK